ncbi:MAG: 5'/3'-nucleotidase SurE [Treponema sp.]|jgi:5'-nucleotidase|nr:5'/3'-nucleotidase SurE [Treponema sp.]
MNILLTNDDGIESEGLRLLADALRKDGRTKGHRYVLLAPDGDRSGVSQSLRLFSRSVRVRRRGSDEWECDGNPADCVITAMAGAVPGFRPDAVLAGINKGENLGTDIVYSGTAAAARQGALLGAPGIALSLAGEPPFHWDQAIEWVLSRLAYLLGAWRPGCFLNVNIPDRPEGLLPDVHTWPGVKTYHDTLRMQPEGDTIRCAFTKGGSDALDQAGCDWAAVQAGAVSISAVSTQPAAI